MEAGLGCIWGEDPRYFRVDDRNFSGRLKNVLVMTVATKRSDGHLGPAYARFLAVPASNFLSNTYRADSFSNPKDAVGRTLLAFVGKAAGNAMSEFLPDLVKHVRRKKPIVDGT